jgi:hypothetical protein
MVPMPFFGHGPMSPTLADVYMITGLEVTGSVNPHKYKGSSRQTGVRTWVGYKRYIQTICLTALCLKLSTELS